MNEIPLAVYKSESGLVVVPEKAKDRDLSVPEASLEKNGVQFVRKDNSTIYDGDAKDVGRGR